MKSRQEGRRCGEISAGYRFSLVCGAASCLTTLLINIGVTVWASRLTDNDEDGAGRRVLYEGSCDTSKKLNVGLHVLINVLSSCLLAASNYGIQCLSAPTRRQVNEAHAEGEYVDIGILSVRNLRRQRALPRVLWYILVLSSVPLHLLYNSVVFSSLAVAGQYSILHGDDRIEQSSDDFFSAYDMGKTPTRIQSLIEASDRLDNLTIPECIDQYSVPFMTSREDLILVHDISEPYNATLNWFTTEFSSRGEMFRWICDGADRRSDGMCQIKLGGVKGNATNWRPFGARVRYCLSRPMEQQKCRVSFNIWLAVGVIICNFVKMCVLTYMVLCLAPDRLLVLGDAIQSFLAHPDPYSMDSSLVSIRHVRDSYHGDKGPWQGPRRLDPVQKQWITTLKAGRRGALGIYFYSFTATAALCFFLWSTLSSSLDFGMQMSLGFGQPNNNHLVSIASGSGGVAANAAVANLPHLIFSFVYFQWNALFTSMAMGEEWNDYSQRRAALRVSDNPRGEQRSRYFLQLPYRFSIPMILVSIILHWLLSQAVFIVAIEKVQLGSRPPAMSWGVVACGYSPVAVMTILAVSLVIPGSICIFGWRRYPGPMPVVGSCSLAIAAACHHPDGEGHPEVALGALKWGVMVDWNRKAPGQGEQYEEGEEMRGLLPVTVGFGHCGFSDEFVDEPQEGQVYS